MSRWRPEPGPRLGCGPPASRSELGRRSTAAIQAGSAITRIEVDAGLVLVVILLAAVLYVVVVAARKQQLLGRPGGLQLALRVGHDSWKLGVGRYAGDDLLWYGAWRPGRRPNRALSRKSLEITGQRGRRANEAILPEGYTVVECRDSDETVSLCLSVAAVTGFLSWLEASAPRS